MTTVKQPSPIRLLALAMLIAGVVSWIWVGVGGERRQE